MNLRATVLVPTHDHGPTLVHSVGTALAQTVADIEVIIVGDGVDDVARDVIADLQRGDDRVQFLDFPKGPRHGDSHRHTALETARGRIICYLSDDDLWLPDHLAILDSLLRDDVGFAHTLPLRIGPTGGLYDWPVDLAIPYYREQTMFDRNWVPLSSAGHTVDAYRRLPVGWSTPPPRVTGSTTYMWQKLLTSGCGAVSGSKPTLLVFPSPDREGWPIEQRVEELAMWRRRSSDAVWRLSFQAQVIEYLVHERARAASETPRARLYGLLARLRLLNQVRRLRKAAKAVIARGAR
jgi:GalNAc5-diNAcBac-PP-undecaprenol beta-1,3-glucosyltransferase